ncbi:nucleolar protein,Nop52-domain-containing protein [Amanita rubescens]|nr:nucleolar protein,Nop52-domain-containing protein [Amanita rubescens]
MASATTVPPLAKYLASTDKKTRDKAIKQLSEFLSSDTSQDAWKGIFYCFWMSDKPLVQQALASELADLLLSTTSTSASLMFLCGFWETTVREWNGIDRLRIDKYYMLVRRFVNATFRLLIRTEWNITACEDYNNILTVRGGPLCPSDIRVPTSLIYHLADIYLEELEKALIGSPSAPPAPLLIVLKPFFSLAAKTQHKTMYQRIQSALLSPLFSALSDQDLPDDGSTNSPGRNRFPNAKRTELKKKLISALLDIAESSDARDSNRRKLHALFNEETEGVE